MCQKLQILYKSTKQNMPYYQNISPTKQSLPSRGINNSPNLWTEQKQTRDMELWGNKQRFWVIENKVYDLTSYIDSHPGGAHWLTLTQGQDITEHFITHHLNESKARAVLSKYFVRQARVRQQPRFTFQQNGLFRRVKSKLLKKYSPQQLQNCSKSVLDGTIIIGIWLCLLVLTGYYQSLIFAVLCGFFIYPIVGVAHNFVHMKNHPFRFLWLFTGFTHREWQQMHCISHHSYANTLIDYQIQALEPLIYYLRIMPGNSPAKWFLKQIVLMLLTPFNMLTKLLLVPLVKRTQPDWLYLVPLIQIPILCLLTQDISIAVKLFLVIHISFSFLFSKMTFLGHRTGFQWTEGNAQIKDFGQHQVNASSDTVTQSCRGLMSYILYAGFNYHAIHHFFPTIDNHSLPEANAILQQQAKSLGIKINKHKGVFWALLQIQKNFFTRKTWGKSA